MALPPMNQTLKDIFNATYQYRQRFQNPTEDSDFWMAAANEMTAIANRFPGSNLAKSMLIACYADVEREYMESKYLR